MVLCILNRAPAWQGQCARAGVVEVGRRVGGLDSVGEVEELGAVARAEEGEAVRRARLELERRRGAAREKDGLVKGDRDVDTGALAVRSAAAAVVVGRVHADDLGGQGVDLDVRRVAERKLRGGVRQGQVRVVAGLVLDRAGRERQGARAGVVEVGRRVGGLDSVGEVEELGAVARAEEGEAVRRARLELERRRGAAREEDGLVKGDRDIYDIAPAVRAELIGRVYALDPGGSGVDLDVRGLAERPLRGGERQPQLRVVAGLVLDRAGRERQGARAGVVEVGRRVGGLDSVGEVEELGAVARAEEGEAVRRARLELKGGRGRVREEDGLVKGDRDVDWHIFPVRARQIRRVYGGYVWHDAVYCNARRCSERTERANGGQGPRDIVVFIDDSAAAKR